MMDQSLEPVDAKVWTPTSLCAAMSRGLPRAPFSDEDNINTTTNTNTPVPPPRINTSFPEKSMTSQSDYRTITEITFDFEYPPLSNSSTPTTAVCFSGFPRPVLNPATDTH